MAKSLKPQEAEFGKEGHITDKIDFIYQLAAMYFVITMYGSADMIDLFAPLGGDTRD